MTSEQPIKLSIVKIEFLSKMLLHVVIPNNNKSSIGCLDIVEHNQLCWIEYYVLDK